jgi:cobalt-zinc-cadmium efflux system outer membrane protein
MDRHVAGRTWWTVPTLFLMGCATAGRDAYGQREPEVAGGATDEAPGSPTDDDRVLSGPVLERGAYVGAVLHRNRSIESARQAWRAAMGRARQTGALEDPMVNVEVAPLSIGSSSARFGWTAMISQHLPWPGKLALDESVAHAEADAAKSDFEASRRELALTASLLFDQYFVAARSIEINAHHVELMRHMQAAATAQYEVGRGSAQDSLQAEFELTHMEHDTLILASQRDVTVAQMNELLHRAPELPLPPPPKELSSPPAPDLAEAGRLEAEAVDRRPDIVAAREHARAQQARADRGSREYLPDVTVSTSFNSMWDMPEHRWMVGLGFNLPVQTGRRGGTVDEAKAMRAQYEADAARMTDAARTQVVVALKQLDESAHVLHLFEKRLLPVARDEVDAARAAFTASQAPFASVVDAEKNLRGVELDQQMARADYDRRRAELDRALGRIPGLAGNEVTP